MALKDMLSHGVKNTISHFVQGLVVLSPLAITVFVLYKIFDFIHSAFHFKAVFVNQYIDPFLIVLVIIFLVYVVGLISSMLIFEPVYHRIEKNVEKVPFIRGVYSSIKDIMGAFVGSKRKFNRPVLVTLDKANNIKQMGFITEEDLSGMGIGKEYTAVYLPFSYGFSGKLVIVQKDSITPVDANGTDAMKFIVSGGVTHVD